MGKALFAEEPDSGYRLLMAVLTAALIMFVDARSTWLHPVRTFCSIVTEPLVALADVPREVAVGVADALTLRSSLVEENARLRQENLVLNRHVQRLAALTSENRRLRELLDSSALLDSSVVVAEIIGFDPDPSRLEVIIDKGQANGLRIGQPILDASGILGQVVNVGREQSRVLLVTDGRHGIPVEISRNGVRGIAVGAGRNGKLQLQYMPVTADVRAGDVLVSSGLGGVFPRGYPVAKVDKVARDPGETFMTVDALPAAAVERSRQVLVLFPEAPAAPAAAPPPELPAAPVVPAASGVQP